MPQTTLIVNPRDLKTRSLEISYHIAFAKQDINTAYETAKTMQEIVPDVPGLEERVKKVEMLKETNTAAQSLVYLTKYLESSGEPHKVRSLIKAIPSSLEQEQFISQMKNKYIPARIWDKKEIAIMIGPCF